MPNNINLSPKNTYSHSSVFLAWLSSKGKYIVLLFNILLFLIYMFSLSVERENIIISTEINKDINKIKSLEESARLYNKFQSTVDLVSTELSSDANVPFILDFLRKSTPSGIIITNISYSDGLIRIVAKSKDSIIFSSFIQLMSSEAKFTSVNLVSSSYNETDASFITNFEIGYN